MKTTLLFLFFLILYQMQIQAQYLVAHRGASYLAPENTVASAKLAWELDADAVEIDVYLSKDGVIVVNHDKDTKRTSGETFVIKDTDAARLRQLDVGSYKDKKYKGEKMPILEEIIATVPPGKELFIEIKCGPEIVPVLEKEINKSDKKDQMVIIGFDKEVVVKAKKQMPAIPVYWLRGNFTEYSLDEVITIAKDNRLDGLDLSYKLVTSELMQRMEQEGLEVQVYTVNDAKEAKKLMEMKVAGITTDRPQWLREQIFP
jgi:glycerophosphoryl diester phosphodiesterase